MPIQNYPTVFGCTEMTAAVNKLPARPFFFKPLFGEGREDHDRFPRHQERPHRADRGLGAQYRP